MKKLLKVFIIIFVFFLFSDVRAMVEINSSKAVLYNLNDDNIIYSKDMHVKTQVASLTKIMTAIVAIENINNLDEKVVVQANDFVGLTGYAKAGFKIGDQVSYRDLIYALMLPSGADAANILVNNIAPGEQFISLMNKKVNDLGLENTYFSNSIGMDESNYSTAYDMAIILKEALKNDFFKEVFNSSEYITSSNLKLTKTTNKTAFLYNLDISNITGSKTGSTFLADYCLASTANINDVSYLAITLNGKEITSHIQDTLSLYNYYSSNYSYKVILDKKQLLKTLKVEHSKQKEYHIYSNKKIKKYLSNSIKNEKIKYQYIGKKIINKKIQKGDYLGKINIIYDNQILDSYKVYLEEDIKYYNYYLLLIPVCLLLMFIMIILAKRTSKRRKDKKQGLT